MKIVKMMVCILWYGIKTIVKDLYYVKIIRIHFISDWDFILPSEYNAKYYAFKFYTGLFYLISKLLMEDCLNIKHK